MNLFKFDNRFKDNMIFQREREIKLYGSCTGLLKVEIEFEGKTYDAEISGVEWQLVLPPLESSNIASTIKAKSGNETIYLNNILIGDIWFCSGQSNMAMTVSGLEEGYQKKYTGLVKTNLIRVMTIRNDSSTGSNNVAMNLPVWENINECNFFYTSAFAYGFAHRLNNQLNIPIGIIVCAVEGTCIEQWIPEKTLAKSGIDIKTYPEERYRKNLFESMVSKLDGVLIKGMVWYQGEDNVDLPSDYKELFSEYLKDYREFFKDKILPVILIQLPNYHYINWIAFRDMQWKLMDNRFVYTACGIDLGEFENVHPNKKYEYSQRAAAVALQKVYMCSINGMSPYPSLIKKITGGLIIKFQDCGKGLVINDCIHEDLKLLSFDCESIDYIIELSEFDTVYLSINVPSDVDIVEYSYRNMPSSGLRTEDSLPVAPFKIKIGNIK